ncbi:MULTISPECIES: DUF2393 family protein [unclassified Campylobacter]|uniref:DUF2393 family protein n=1 Tax=unclassified Campylobacter TaxID=2593542 RepID=UPI001237C3CE|nr:MULTISPECIES: DUF2393 family protein [unclassified Campylobacter]KAA6225173.1 DUF2393 domain-containing protein [Campylobacter sp. LR196d]KAA6226185.1 DUF2393 domain-containing protein [Campylobacter sp. LR185c]KAA6229015.1 DUF2393 domain-containing protein [Campylobacter sp. LR286c]KAA6231386.1 DUF2393 domain-containing protein [Campylobacter sp. LR264d]KAA6231598.1 DUF2393 domain-containing protein [Campylobacter sp. LR291e]
MHFTLFHWLSLLIFIALYVIACVLIFLKVKTKKEFVLIAYTIATIFTAILIYSVFSMINQFITQADLIKLTYARNLKNESVIVSGRVENLTKYDIKKCYLHLTITNKKVTGGEVFDNKNIKSAQMKNTSAVYTIEIVDYLPGNTYKDFQAEVPFPPQFNIPQFYHILKCI